MSKKTCIKNPTLLPSAAKTQIRPIPPSIVNNTVLKDKQIVLCFPDGCFPFNIQKRKNGLLFHVQVSVDWMKQETSMIFESMKWWFTHIFFFHLIVIVLSKMYMAIEREIHQNHYVKLNRQCYSVFLSDLLTHSTATILHACVSNQFVAFL